MTLTALDLKSLRWGLIGLGLALVMGGASLWVANNFRLAGQKENKIAIAKRAEAKSKLARVSQEEKELTDKTLLFQELVKLGYTQQESRLDMVELLERLRKKHRISDFQYEFAAQQPLDSTVLPGGSFSGGFDFLTSKQHITMKVLHEGDVWTFTNDLKREARAMILIRSCVLERLPIPPNDRGSGPYLSADCTLDWISLRERK